MPKIVLVDNRTPVECIGCANLRDRDFQKLGKELAVFMFHHSPAGFWDGFKKVAGEIADHPRNHDESAMYRHFLGEPQHEDEEEAVFE